MRAGIRLSLWNKRAPCAQGGDRYAVLLLHGATYSSRPDYDLQVRDYSLMNALALAGFDVWALDVHGYGYSQKENLPDRSDTVSAVKDVEAAVEYVLKSRGDAKLHLFGWSWGTQVAGSFAMLHGDKLASLTLYAPFWRGIDAWRKTAPPTELRRSNVPADMSDFVPGEYDPDVRAEYQRQIEQVDPTSPTGSWVDLHTKLPMLDPRRICSPTLLIYGRQDPLSQTGDLLPFFEQLCAHDKRYVILPRGGHVVMLENDHRRFQREVIHFLRLQDAHDPRGAMRPTPQGSPCPCRS
jgi:pimeloyl-ACP methyl ester carboxylesterase